MMRFRTPIISLLFFVVVPMANNGLALEVQFSTSNSTLLISNAEGRGLTQDVQALLSQASALEKTMKLLNENPAGVSLADLVGVQTGLTLSRENTLMNVDSNTELWLYQPRTATKGQYHEVLFAYAPKGDERGWVYIEAFDRFGNRLLLDPYIAPSVPVIVIETQGLLALQHKAAAMNRMLAEAGLQSKYSDSRPTINMAVSEDTSKLTKIRLNNDEEPWIKGAAEIYMITSGVKSDDNDPEVRVTALPYLDHEDENYYPNQLVLFWNDYSYNAANIQFWEEDGDTNYQGLTQALIDAIGQAGNLAGLPELTAVTEIANIIIEAMPDNWFTDDDDFVDVCYTLERSTFYTDHYCAAGNARLSLEPFVLTAN